MSSITPAEMKPLLTGEREIAFLDVREAGQYGEGHPFFAISIPYSRLELCVERLVPRKSVSVVVMDDGEGSGLGEMAASRLAGLGYTDIKILEGGAAGWTAAGHTLYKGVNLPSKTFGELVEHAAHTPSITARQLREMQAQGQAMILLDGRTPHEYRRMTIPGSRSCPNAELGHRLPVLIDDSRTPVIVNCAGRTRSIIGAQGLIDMGIANPVYALENGTQGWSLAGFELEVGTEPQPAPDLGPAALARSRQTAEDLRKKFNLRSIRLDELHAWQGAENRTLYLLDVRTLEEYESGHLPGAVHAPGGQLVQATDQWAAVRGGRIVLCDDTGLRAAQTALWLSRMGHDVCTLGEDLTGLAGLETGGVNSLPIRPGLPECAPAQTGARMAAGAVLIDLRASADFREGHIAGARWSIRPRLGRLGLAKGDEVLLAGGPVVAELAARDLREFGCTRIANLTGGPADWSAAGLEIAASPNDPPDADRIDYLFFVHDRHSGNKEAMRGYLEWETGLVAQLDEQERGVFTLDF